MSALHRTGRFASGIASLGITVRGGGATGAEAKPSSRLGTGRREATA